MRLAKKWSKLGRTAMQDQKDRVILDTNILISLLITRDFLKFDKLITQDKVVFILSQELIEEFVEVAQRPKLKKYFAWTSVEKFILAIKNISELINVETNISVCRDPKDDFLLALAIDGQATHLITGDKDILVLKKIGKATILTMAEYLSDK
ncbi:MAG TPA: putative toxin-antitoxin system toxin component, PIN family [Mucilaginibacter sp.]|nr:putative toxin-antitoxin system toxin component, PIN family [Mucilaginibacter sp.]